MLQTQSVRDPSWQWLWYRSRPQTGSSQVESQGKYGTDPVSSRSILTTAMVQSKSGTSQFENYPDKGYDTHPDSSRIILGYGTDSDKNQSVQDPTWQGLWYRSRQEAVSLRSILTRAMVLTGQEPKKIWYKPRQEAVCTRAILTTAMVQIQTGRSQFEIHIYKGYCTNPDKKQSVRDPSWQRLYSGYRQRHQF